MMNLSFLNKFFLLFTMCGFAWIYLFLLKVIIKSWVTLQCFIYLLLRTFNFNKYFFWFALTSLCLSPVYPQKVCALLGLFAQKVCVLLGLFAPKVCASLGLALQFLQSKASVPSPWTPLSALLWKNVFLFILPMGFLHPDVLNTQDSFILVNSSFRFPPFLSVIPPVAVFDHTSYSFLPPLQVSTVHLGYFSDLTPFFWLIICCTFPYPRSTLFQISNYFLWFWFFAICWLIP